MDSPFFRNYYYAPTSPYYAHPSPARSTMPTRRPAARPAHTQPSPRVVSIPIHFVGSERSRSEAAVRIQRVFRGFLVRRAVRKIRAVSAEVGAMERRVEDGGMADGLRRGERERLRVNESLMGLLFRLDSVPGVDSAVRDCRKKVIRRVVALQERVDALAQEVNDSETRDSTDSDGNPDSLVEEKADPDQTMEDHSDPVLEGATVLEAGPVVQVHPKQTMKEFVDEEGNLASGDEECVVDLIQEAGNAEVDLKEVVEKMVEENKKLQRMVSELCEREVSQSRMMNSLSQRVEALEKAFSKRRKTTSCNARKERYVL